MCVSATHLAAAPPAAPALPFPHAPAHIGRAVTLAEVSRVHVCLETVLLASHGLHDDAAVVAECCEHFGVDATVARVVLLKLREQNPAFFAALDAARAKRGAVQCCPLAAAK